MSNPSSFPFLLQRKAKTAHYLLNLEFHIFIWTTTIVLFKYLYAVFSFILHCWMCCCFSWSSDAPRKQILTFPEGQNTALLWILCNEEKDHRDLLFRKVQSDSSFFYFYLHCMKNRYVIYVKYCLLCLLFLRVRAFFMLTLYLINGLVFTLLVSWKDYKKRWAEESHF